MSQYIQLGASGSFVAPASGQLTLLCNDSQASDNSGSITVNIAGTSFAVPATAGTASGTGVPGPSVIAGQQYAYSVTGQQRWSINSSETSLFDAGGNPAPGNSNTPFDYTVARPNGELGLIQFSLIGRIDAPSAASSGVPTRLFSTGNLTCTFNGTTYVIAVLQNISLESAFQSKPLHDAAQNGRFPIDMAFSDGSYTIKVTNADIDITALQLLAGAIAQAQTAGEFPGTGIQEIIDGTVSLPGFEVNFTGQTTSGKSYILMANNVYAKGFSWPFKQSDYVMQGFELTAIADANGIVATLGFQQ